MSDGGYRLVVEFLYEVTLDILWLGKLERTPEMKTYILMVSYLRGFSNLADSYS